MSHLLSFLPRVLLKCGKITIGPQALVDLRLSFRTSACMKERLHKFSKQYIVVPLGIDSNDRSFFREGKSASWALNFHALFIMHNRVRQFLLPHASTIWNVKNCSPISHSLLQNCLSSDLSVAHKETGQLGQIRFIPCTTTNQIKVAHFRR